MRTIMLRRYKGRKPIPVLIDDEDYEAVAQYSWRKGYLGYVHTDIDGKREYLHRFLMGFPEGKVVDHINGDRQDNRRCNLRLCTTQQNCMNARLNRNSTSGHTGVSYRPKRKSWRAYIMVDRKQIGLGHYPTKKEAIAARKRGEREYFGEFAPSLSRAG